MAHDPVHTIYGLAVGARRAPPRPLVALVLVTTLTGCFDGPGFLKQGSAVQTVDTGGPALAEVQSNEGGVMVAAMKADADTDQMMSASEDSEIAGSSVVIPAGALAVDTTVTMEEGTSLAGGDEAIAVGVTETEASGAAVVLSSSEDVAPSTPMTIALPLPAGAGLQDGLELERLIVLFKAKIPADQGGGFLFGVIPRSQIKLENGQAKVEAKYFGSYQTVIATEVVEAASVKTERPIVTEREQEEIESTPINPEAFAILEPKAMTKVAFAKWEPADKATGYQVVVAGNAECSGTAALSKKTSATSVSLAGISDGGWYLCVTALGEYGGKKAATNNGKPFTFDATAPTVSVSVAEVSGKPMARKLTATVEETNPGSLEWAKISGPGTLTQSDVTTKSVVMNAGADGTYKVSLTVTDKAGNVAATTASFTIASAQSQTFFFSTSSSVQAFDARKVKFLNGQMHVRAFDLVDDAPDAAGNFGFDGSQGGLWDGTAYRADAASIGAELPSPVDVDPWFPHLGIVAIAHMSDFTKFVEHDGDQGTATLGAPGPTGVSGQVGDAASFSGSPGDFISLAADLPIIDSTFTIMAWVQATGSGGVIAYQEDDNGKEVVAAVGTALTLRVGDATNNCMVQAMHDLRDGLWHHVAFTYAGTCATVGIYVDGSPVSVSVGGSGTEPAPGAFSFSGGDDPILLGGDGASALNGALDEVAIWHFALTAMDVAFIHKIQSKPWGFFYDSVPRDFGQTFEFGSLFIQPQWPTGLPLPDGGHGDDSRDETGYGAYGLDMTSAIAVLHFEEAQGAVPLQSMNSSLPSPAFGGGGSDPLKVGGVLGSALRFGSTTTKTVSIANSPDLDFTTTDDFTISFWVRMPDTGGMDFYPFHKFGSSGWKIRVAGDGELWVRRGGVDFDGSACPAVDDGAWHHVAVVQDALPGDVTDLRIHVDGEAACATSNITTASSNLPDFTDTASLAIGLITSGYMTLDEIGIWTTALSATQVTGLYRRGAQSVEMQIRNCVASDCDNELFSDSTGNATASFDQTMSTGATPTWNFSQRSGSYAQYRMYLGSLHEAPSAVSPGIQKVSLGNEPLYADSGVMTALFSRSYSKLSGFEEVTSGNGEVYYLVSPDNGANWWGRAANGAWAKNGQMMTADEIHGIITTLPVPSTAASRVLKVKLALTTDPGASPSAFSLEKILVGYTP